MNGLALFAGVGGLELGINQIFPNSRTVCYVEGEAYNIEVLQNKIEKKQLEEGLIFSDVQTFGKICHVFSGKVDFISGGFPCQPFSTAGQLKGTKDTRWLWDSILEIIGQVRPSYLFLENVSNIINEFGAFDEITKSLSKIGFNCEWSTLRASDVGANHHRNRAFIFAYIPEHLQFINPVFPNSDKIRRGEEFHSLRGGQFDLEGGYNDTNSNRERRHELDNAAESIETCRQSNKSYSSIGNDADADSCKKANGRQYENDEKTSFERQNVEGRSPNISRQRRFQKARCIERNATDTNNNRSKEIGINSPEWWQNEPSMGRVVDGVAFGMDRIRACGNGVVPLQAAIAYYGLIKRAKKIMEVKQ